ncbi:hypothetical protein D3C73_762490 [compost metagenome]
MRGNALGGEAQALVDAETMLFIDHRHHQVGVAHRILKQRMGADDDLRFARCNAFDDRVALAALGAAG